MATSITETLGTAGANAVYVKHPPAGDAASFVDDGAPVDSGTWSIVANNFAVLRRESMRHLFTDLGPGDLTFNETGGWNDLAETVPESGQRTALEEEIAWNLVGSPTARCYGPFPILLDRAAEDAGGAWWARAIRVKVRAYGSEDFKLYAALTEGYAPPSAGWVDLKTLTCNGSSTSTSPEDLTFADLKPDVRQGTIVSTLRPSAPPTADGATNTDVMEVFLWIGWRVAEDMTAGWLSVTAYELIEV